MEPKRLNKYISDAGFCSRREADRLIEEGRVTVNNKTPDAGTKVGPKDKVRIDDELLHVREEEIVFLLFNKPAGIATTTDLSVRNNIISALNYPATLQPIGHLDREAEGLMFLSNDTELARKMTKADTRFEKEYVLTLDKPVTGEFLTRISEGGAPTPGTSRKKVFVAKEGTNRFRIVLEPGMNHHIKRMCEALGYKVTHLQRVRIANFTPIKLQTGHWRTLTEAEVETLKKIAGTKSGKSGAATKREEDAFFGESLPARSRAARAPGSGKRSGPPTSGNKRTSNTDARSGAKSAATGRKPEVRSNASPTKRTPGASGGRRGRSTKGTTKR
ncbi:pseudouridine synthase [Adhaeribacter rhizoryzae]|uniref:Pseudouridine synthase n=1 Tax=Adhaeribacter rhizoryzae TaxID=2607907 RepID=A0A5M6DJT6_9BACT|nr:pseudouridine synthase [Adhaeribacter rhizoryzae]KAA5546489.1 pseudouridine synthase [Adhaeribacter rhizoryzae]